MVSCSGTTCSKTPNEIRIWTKNYNCIKTIIRKNVGALISFQNVLINNNSKNGNIILWKKNNKICKTLKIRRFRQQEISVWLVITSDKNSKDDKLFSGSYMGDLINWDTKLNWKLLHITKYWYGIRDLEHYNEYIYIGFVNDNIGIYNYKTNTKISTINLDGNRLYTMIIYNDKIITGNNKGIINILPINTIQ